MEKKYCSNCKWSRPDGYKKYLFNLRWLINRERWRFARCMHPCAEIKESDCDSDLIHPKLKVIYLAHMHCVHMRKCRVDEYCGPEGKLWEAK